VFTLPSCPSWTFSCPSSRTTRHRQRRRAIASWTSCPSSRSRGSRRRRLENRQNEGDGKEEEEDVSEPFKEGGRGAWRGGETRCGGKNGHGNRTGREKGGNPPPPASSFAAFLAAFFALFSASLSSSGPPGAGATSPIVTSSACCVGTRDPAASAASLYPAPLPVISNLPCFLPPFSAAEDRTETMPSRCSSARRRDSSLVRDSIPMEGPLSGSDLESASERASTRMERAVLVATIRAIFPLSFWGAWPMREAYDEARREGKDRRKCG
jgi:hypothetical protein